MNDTHLLRAAAVDLLSFAAAEEQALLTATAGSEGKPDNWAAALLLAPNNQFNTSRPNESAPRSGQARPPLPGLTTVSRWGWAWAWWRPARGAFRRS